MQRIDEFATRNPVVFRHSHHHQVCFTPNFDDTEVAPTTENAPEQSTASTQANTVA